MYKIDDAYIEPYNEYISNPGREFKLKCTIKNGSSTSSISQSNISSLQIDHDLVSGAEDYVVGNLAAAKLTITFDNTVNVKEGSIISLEVGLKTILKTGYTHWVYVPLGSFFVFEINKTALTQRAEGYDGLYQKKLADAYRSKLEYPTSSRLILEELCTLLDVEYPSDIPNEPISRPKVVNDLKLNDDGKYEVVETSSNQVGYGLTIGAMLSYMASYYGGSFILEGNNKLKLVKVNMSNVTKAYDLNHYATPTVGDASYNIKCIKCTISAGETLVHGVGEESQTMEMENPFYDDYRLSELATAITNMSYKPVNVRIKGDPAIQLGDVICLNNAPHIGTIKFPILKMKFSFSGGCKLEVESVCRTESEKAIKYKGTLSSRLDTLETTVSKTNTEIDKLNNSIRVLNQIQKSLGDMSLFIDKNLAETLSASDLDQYDLLLSVIERSRAEFNDKYNLVYDHKYLKRT